MTWTGSRLSDKWLQRWLVSSPERPAGVQLAFVEYVRTAGSAWLQDRFVAINWPHTYM